MVSLATVEGDIIVNQFNTIMVSPGAKTGSLWGSESAGSSPVA